MKPYRLWYQFNWKKLRWAEIWVEALFSTSQLKEVAAAATANDEYHMLAGDIASMLFCVCWFGKVNVIFCI